VGLWLRYGLASPVARESLVFQLSLAYQCVLLGLFSLYALPIQVCLELPSPHPHPAALLGRHALEAPEDQQPHSALRGLAGLQHHPSQLLQEHRRR